MVDGKPEVRIRKGRNSGQPTKRHLSRRRFQKALGVAPTREAVAGKRQDQAFVGWRYGNGCLSASNPKKGRVKNHMGKQLGELLDTQKKIRPVKLARSRVCSKAASMLFRELVKEISN